MTTRVLLAALVLVAVAGIAVPAAADYQDDAERDDAPVGAEIATAVQTTDAEAGSAVEDGVFEARFERADEDERAALLERRSERLDARADRLEARVDDVEGDRANDSVRYRARAVGAAAQLRALERSTNRTEQRARDAGFQPAGLANVRERTDALERRDGVRIGRGLQEGAAGPGAPDGVPGRGPDAGNASDRDDGPGEPPGGAADDAADDAPEPADGRQSDDGVAPDTEPRDDQQAPGRPGAAGDGTENGDGASDDGAADATDGGAADDGSGASDERASDDRPTGSETPDAPDAGPDAVPDEQPPDAGL